MPSRMQNFRYAVVAYVGDPIAQFVTQIRQQVHPDLPLLAAHVTILPPRVLQDSEASALAAVRDICRHVEPFQVTLGEVETFIPVTPTVIIRVTHAYRIRELHDRLAAAKSLSIKEEWHYLPHLTIVKLVSEAQAQAAYRVAQHAWSAYEKERCAWVKNFTFVQERAANEWIDIATIPLGG